MGQWPCCAQADRLLSRVLGLRRLEMRFYSAAPTADPILLLHLEGLLTHTRWTAIDPPAVRIQTCPHGRLMKCCAITILCTKAVTHCSNGHLFAGLQFLRCLDRLSVELTGCRGSSLLHGMLEVRA